MDYGTLRLWPTNIIYKNIGIINNINDLTGIIEDNINAYLKEIVNTDISKFSKCIITSEIKELNLGQYLEPSYNLDAFLSCIVFIEGNFQDSYIELNNPSGNSNRFYGYQFEEWFRRVSITPVVGDMIILPGHISFFSNPAKEIQKISISHFRRNIDL